MTRAAIHAEHLGKRYRIGHRVRSRTARDAMSGAASRLIRSLRFGASKPAQTEDMLWAIDDVSFDVAAGEVVGIIGRNGAGKSTLLKVLSQITEPTTGFVDVTGRIGSLLEVGTGFHEDLSGRENTYLNGAILGMNKAEIDRKFDEIVALFMPRMAPFKYVFSRPLRSSWKPVPTSSSDPIRPVTSTKPVVGSVICDSTFKSVDLPAPLRPMMPTTSPAATSNDTSLSAQSVSSAFIAAVLPNWRALMNRDAAPAIASRAVRDRTRWPIM
jgi:energy-coupling factor transporter ATP-binding protein EcfA2